MGQNKSGFVFWPISDFGGDGALYQASGDPSPPLQSSPEAEAKAADNADEGDGEPEPKKPRTE